MESNENQTNDHVEHKETEEQKENKKVKKINFTHLTSGVIGGIISALLIIGLIASNLLPLQQGNNEPNSTVLANQKDESISSGINLSEDNIPSNLDEVAETVVGIINLQQQNIWTPSEEVGSGSGIIYKKEDGKAYIVTNNHVVKDAEEVEVVLSNDDRMKASVLGTDELTDLAVLEVDDEKIDIVANLGKSKDLTVGETVVAIGNPLGMDFAGSVTKGIISGLNRSVEVDTNGDQQTDWVTEVIQTDAAINPGNSGGALVNGDGEVIGINTMKIARAAVEGIGLAIPIDTALPIMDQLETNGEVTRPFIGIHTVTLNQVPPQFQQEINLPDTIKGGMVVAQVQANSPAADAGLQQFDVITKINDEEVHSLLDLRKYMYSETTVGDTIKMEVYRDGKSKVVDMKLAEKIDKMD